MIPRFAVEFYPIETLVKFLFQNKLVEKFENECDILLVTATNDCAGLHLPFVSHIIFYHKIIDHNIESQIAARGQRLGRKSNLEIISLLYQYE